jgi:hypothetical protein
LDVNHTHLSCARLSAIKKAIAILAITEYTDSNALIVMA